MSIPEPRDFESMKSGGQAINAMLIGAVVLAAAGYFLFIRLPGHAEITSMVPGINGAGTGLECWLTIDLKDAPSGDIRDLRVVFTSEALERQESFDWEFIAWNDYHGVRGLIANKDSTPETTPPVGKALKVKFPLKAKMRLENASGMDIPLHAEVRWGGEAQDRMRRNIGHVYESEGSPFPL